MLYYTMKIVPRDQMIISHIIVAVFLWLTQLIVLLIVRGIIKLIQKMKDRKETTI